MAEKAISKYEKQMIRAISIIFKKSRVPQSGINYAMGEKIKLSEIFSYAIADGAQLIEMGKMSEAAALAAHICAVIEFVQSGNRKGTFNG